MSLLDMILSGKTDKESYLKAMESVSSRDIFYPEHKDVQPLSNKETASRYDRHSLFSVALFSLDTEFLEAVYDKFSNKVTFATLIAQKTGDSSRYSTKEEIKTYYLFKQILESTPDNYYFPDTTELLKSICLKYMNQYSYFMSEGKYYLKGKDEYYYREKKNDDLLKYGIHLKSAPILIHLYFKALQTPHLSLSYAYKKASLTELSFMLDVFNNYKNLLTENTKMDLSKITEKEDHLNKFNDYIHSTSALFDIVSGFTKKQETNVEAKIDFLLSSNKTTILKEATTNAQKLLGKSDIAKIISADKEKKYPMAYAILKNSSQIVNKLLEHGYNINEEEISLLMANKVKDELKEEYKSLLSENLDELSVLVKEFEKLFRKVASR